MRSCPRPSISSDPCGWLLKWTAYPVSAYSCRTGYPATVEGFLMPLERQRPRGAAISTREGSPQDVAKPGVRLAIVAAIACTAQFMVVLDSSIVNVAIPSMRTGLGLSATAQQWIVNGYLIT